MQIIWDKPSLDGGSMVTGYYLERRDKKSLRWVKVYKDPISDTKAKVHHLTEGNEYQYRVCAINKAGEGPYTDVSDFYKAADPVGMYYLYNFNKLFIFTKFIFNLESNSLLTKIFFSLKTHHMNQLS